MLLDYLIFNKHRLGDNLGLYSSHFITYPHSHPKIKNYSWAVIYLKQYNNKELTFRQSPQLVISISEVGISCGFSYGVEVEDNSDFVNNVKKILATEILNKNLSSTYFRVRKASPKYEVMIYEITEFELFEKWNHDAQITTMVTTDFVKNGDLTEAIVLALDSYAPLFLESIKV